MLDQFSYVALFAPIIFPCSKHAILRFFQHRRRLAGVFQTAGVDVLRPLTTTSYVGTAACLVALAAVHCGARDVAVYTGSWTEWAQLADSRLIVYGEGGLADARGLCPRQWNSLKTAFIDGVIAGMRRSATNCHFADE